jgi:hypothetical protein
MSKVIRKKQRTAAEHSLQKMLEDMSPFLPKRDLLPTSQPSDWKIAHPATDPARQPKAISRKRE